MGVRRRPDHEATPGKTESGLSGVGDPWRAEPRSRIREAKNSRCEIIDSVATITPSCAVRLIYVSHVYQEGTKAAVDESRHFCGRELVKDQLPSGLWIQESFVPSGLMLFFGPDVPALKRWAIIKQDASTRNAARGKAGLSKRRGYSGPKERTG